MKTKSRHLIIKLSGYAERYLLSLLFLFLATSEVKNIRGILKGVIAPETNVFIDVIHHFILLLLGLFTGLLLLVARRAVEPPARIKQVLIPLVTTFFYLFYYSAPLFPASWQANLGPKVLQMPLLAAGFACLILGPTVALLGLLHLGRSFGIFVAVRKVVTTGPYQWVRHPMYLGGVFLCLGVALANFSAVYFFLVTLHVSLLVYRAHLEQEQLSAQSAEYREYMKRTRFIFPRMRRPILRRVKSPSGK
jgi:protein-S-isoprenylcysteine O-methyltransferase Ste14